MTEQAQQQAEETHEVRLEVNGEPIPFEAD